MAGHIRSKHAASVTAVITRLLSPHKEKCHTITFDNGKEFAEHESMAAQLKADIYFAHPYSSRERGPNENSNGLIQQYFPKSMDLSDISDENVQWAVERLNHRPCKVLGYRTPHEVFFGGKVLYTKQTPVCCTSKSNPRDYSAWLAWLVCQKLNHACSRACSIALSSVLSIDLFVCNAISLSQLSREDRCKYAMCRAPDWKRL